jgi:ABC-2 type transport system permease protein
MEPALAFGGCLSFYAELFSGRTGIPPGFISISQGEGGRRRKLRTAATDATGKRSGKQVSSLFTDKIAYQSSAWPGIWAVARKDLLSFMRDSRNGLAF